MLRRMREELVVRQKTHRRYRFRDVEKRLRPSGPPLQEHHHGLVTSRHTFAAGCGQTVMTPCRFASPRNFD